MLLLQWYFSNHQSCFNYRSEGYDDDSDKLFLDNEDNNNNPSLDNEDYDENNNEPSFPDNGDCDEENDKSDTGTESDCSKTSKISSYISEENDELTDNDKESEMKGINDGTANSMLLIVILIVIINDIYLF